MVVYHDVKARVAELLAKPLIRDSLRTGNSFREPVRWVERETSSYKPLEFRTGRSKYLDTTRRASPHQRVYELDFDCLKEEILDIKRKSDAESRDLEARSAGLGDLRKRKGPTQESLHTAQHRLRQVQSKTSCKVSKTVANYAENRHKTLGEVHQTKLDALTEIRWTVDNLREKKNDRANVRDSLLEELRLLKQHTPHKKQIILKHRMDMASIKDEQIRKLRSEINKAKLGVADRETGGKTELDRLTTEYDSSSKNLSTLRATLKNVQKEKSDEENNWQKLIDEPRRKLAHYQNQHWQKKQEAVELKEDLMNRAEAALLNKNLVEESVTTLSQKMATQCDRKKLLVTTDHQLTERDHQILCDQRIVEPVVKKIAAKLKLQKSRLSVKFSHCQTTLNQSVIAEDNKLSDLRHKIDVQEEALKQLGEVGSSTEASMSEVRKEEETISRQCLELNAKLIEIKRHFSSLRQKVHELNKWKRKLQAVGVTPECYLKRLRERIEFVNSELLNVHKHQILCQDPVVLRHIRYPRDNKNADRSDLPGYLKDAIPPTSDPNFLETLKEAFIECGSSMPFSSSRCPPEEDCTAICKKYLRSYPHRYSDDETAFLRAT